MLLFRSHRTEDIFSQTDLKISFGINSNGLMHRDLLNYTSRNQQPVELQLSSIAKSDVRVVLLSRKVRTLLMMR